MLKAAQDRVRGHRAARRSRHDLTVSGVITFHLTSSRSAQTPHYLRPRMKNRFAAASIARASRRRNHRPGVSRKARRGQSNYVFVSQELPSPVRLPRAQYFARTAPTEGPALILADYDEQ